MPYKSCGFLNHGLEFRHTNEIAVCSQISHKGGGNIILVNDCSKKDFNVELLVQKKQEIMKQIKNGKVYPNCEGCTDLTDWDDSKELSKIKLLMIQHWTKCNSNCIYCFTAKNKKFYNSYKNNNIYPILKEMVNKEIIDKNGIANFSGGEFTLLKESNKIIDLLTKLNYFIIVNSSGIDYSKKLGERLKKGNSCVIISIDAGSEEVHKKVKRVKTYTKIWKNIRKYALKQSKPYLTNVKYIIIPGYNDEEKEIELWLHNCLDNHINSVILGIDANYFEPNRDNVPDKIFNLFEKTRVLAQNMGLTFTIANRALTMLTKGKYANSFWEKYRFDDGRYANIYFQNNSI